MNQLVHNLVLVAGVGLASIVATLLIAIQRKVLAKLHWQVNAAQEDAERTIIEKAVLCVEQWAARELAPTAVNRAAAKLQKAKMMIQSRCPWLDEIDIEPAIDAALARLGLGPIEHAKQAK